MSIEIFVMPLTRYKMGEFETPLQRMFGDKVRYVYPNQWYFWFSARKQVKQIRKAVLKANGAIAKWNESGKCVYSEQCHEDSMPALRAFACWIYGGKQPEDFSFPESGDYYKHPARKFENDQINQSHLIGGGCYNDYVLPVEFEHVVEVEPYKIFGHWDATRSVTSAIRIHRELKQLKDSVSLLSEDEFWDVHVGYMQYSKVVELALQHQYPIIFWG